MDEELFERLRGLVEQEEDDEEEKEDEESEEGDDSTLDDMPPKGSGSTGPSEPGSEKEEDEEGQGIDPMKVKDIPEKGEEKEYLASKGSDEFFYLRTKYTEAGAIEDREVLNASDEVILSATKDGIDPNDMKAFLLKAIDVTEATMVSFDIISKYIIEPDEDIEQEEAEEETQQVEQEAAPKEEPKQEESPSEENT